MFKVEMNSVKVNAVMDEFDFRQFINENNLSVFTDGVIVFTMYNSFIIRCVK